MTDGKIHNFKITIPMGLSECIISLKKDVVIEADGTFIIGEIDSDGKLKWNSIKGRFDSPTTLAGTYSSTWLCGDQLSFSFSESTWSAEWKRP
jgi:hypothetical protein